MSRVLLFFLSSKTEFVSPRPGWGGCRGQAASSCVCMYSQPVEVLFILVCSLGFSSCGAPPPPLSLPIRLIFCRFSLLCRPSVDHTINHKPKQRPQNGGEARQPREAGGGEQARQETKPEQQARGRRRRRRRQQERGEGGRVCTVCLLSSAF